MYKFTDGLLPSGFNDYFRTQSDIHTYNTRTASRSALGISSARTMQQKKEVIKDKWQRQGKVPV